MSASEGEKEDIGWRQTIRVRLQFLVFVTQMSFPSLPGSAQSLCSLPQGGILG